jgi:hypothetical protein
VTWLVALVVLATLALVALAVGIAAQLRAMSLAFDQVVGHLARSGDRPPASARRSAR